MSTPLTRRTSRALGLAATGALCAIAISACGSSGASSTTTATAPDSTPMSSMPMKPDDSTGSDTKGMGSMKGMVMIEDFSFSVPSSVKAGSSLMVMNMDSEAHTMTADSGDAFDVTVPPGKTVTVTVPDKPGSYPFHCSFHSNMHGTLRVR
jgi:plastocyanin